MIPVIAGPFRQVLGSIAVNVDHSVKSQSDAIRLEYGDEPLVFASEATSVAEGSVTVGLGVPDPVPPDGLSGEEEEQWLIDNYAHCKVPVIEQSTDLERRPYWSETSGQGEVIMQRGRTIVVSTSAKDMRYFIERNTNKVYPLPSDL